MKNKGTPEKPEAKMKQCSTPLGFSLAACPDRRTVVSLPHVILNADNGAVRREMEMLPCGFYSVFTSCFPIISLLSDPCMRFLCALSVWLTVGNGLNHSRSYRGGVERSYSCGYMGANGLGDSWPNVVIVGDKETGRKR